MRRLVPAFALTLAIGAAAPAPVTAFTGFGAVAADSTYGESMVFRVELLGGAPERLELLLDFADDDATFVAPVDAAGTSAEYVWDTADRHVTPNTRITYSWRATDGDAERTSREGTLLYEDDRPGLDWSSARLGEATVHWYGGAEEIARRFGELAADGAERAEELLGHEMSGPIDIFVYDSREEFFGALGPGAREWTGAATYPALRTIFMWLGGGPNSYLETTVLHEVTHVVFNDATTNPYHEPAKWLNEGFASWAERQDADEERSTVAFEASGGGLFAFEAIAEAFPIGDRGSRLAYAQGATMVEMIVDQHGRQAVAGLAAAYRDGASDEEALKAATGMPAEELFAAFFGEFGVDAPQPVEPAPILPSNVRIPGDDPVPGDRSADPNPDPQQPAGGPGGAPWWAALLAVALLAATIGVLVWSARRTAS